MRFAPSENLQTAIPLTSQEDKGYTLLDLLDPVIFDRLKHQIDQSKFFALHHLYSEDEILCCRQAEMLISLQKHEDAIVILTEFKGLLATGLLAKALACINMFGVVKDICRDYYDWSIQRCLELSPLQREGLVHIYEMAFAAAYDDRSFEFAKYILGRANYLAKELGIVNRLHTLENQQVALDTALGNRTVPIAYNGFNQDNASYHNYLKFRTSWLSGEPQLSGELKVFEPVVDAWKYIISGRNQDALAAISDFPKSSKCLEASLYANLVLFTCHLELNATNNPMEVHISSIKKLLPLLKFKTNIIHDCAKLFPLASYMLGYFCQDFIDARASIPLLANEKYGDGLRLGGTIISLPGSFKELWLKDDARKSRESKVLIDRNTNYKTRNRLKEVNLDEFNIVSVVKVYLSLLKLNKQGLILESVLEDFEARYPNVKNYI